MCRPSNREYASICCSTFINGKKFAKLVAAYEEEGKLKELEPFIGDSAFHGLIYSHTSPLRYIHAFSYEPGVSLHMSLLECSSLPELPALQLAHMRSAKPLTIFAVPSKNFEDRLYCALTGMLVARNLKGAEKHMKASQMSFRHPVAPLPDRVPGRTGTYTLIDEPQVCLTVSLWRRWSQGRRFLAAKARYVADEQELLPEPDLADDDEEEEDVDMGMGEVRTARHAALLCSSEPTQLLGCVLILLCLRKRADAISMAS